MTELAIIKSIHEQKPAIIEFVNRIIIQNPDLEFDDDWYEFTNDIDLNVYQDEFGIHITAYPVVEREPIITNGINLT